MLQTARKQALHFSDRKVLLLLLLLLLLLAEITMTPNKSHTANLFSKY